jgi:hypothetical protein
MVSFLLAFPQKYYMHSSLPHACYMLCPSHTPWLHLFNYIWWRALVMKFHIMQFSPTSYHLIPHQSKYYLQHPVLKHPQSMFLPYCQRPSFTCIQNYRQNYTFVLLYVKWLDRGFGLIIGFTVLFKLISTSNHKLFHWFTCSAVFSFCCLHWFLPGNGSQCRRLLSFCVLTSGTCLTTQLGTAWLQFSDKGYSSHPYSSRTACPNCQLRNVPLCCWPISLGPGTPSSDLDCLRLPPSKLNLSANH